MEAIKEWSEGWGALLYSVLFGTVPEASFAIIDFRLEHMEGNYKASYRGPLTDQEVDRIIKDRKRGKPWSYMVKDYNVKNVSNIWHSVERRGIDPKGIYTGKCKQIWIEEEM